MAWVIDTSVLLDIHSADPAFAQASAECVAAHAAQLLKSILKEAFAHTLDD